MVMRKLTSDEFANFLEKYGNYVIPAEEDRLKLISLLSNKETLFPDKPSYIVAYMGSEYNDEGGYYGVLESFAVFDKDGGEIADDNFSRSDKFLEAEDWIRDLVSGCDGDELLIPLEKEWLQEELYIDN